MEEMYKWVWVIILIIGLTAAIKIITLIRQNQTSGSDLAGNGQPNGTVNSAVLQNINETGPMIYFANDRHGSRDKEYRFNYKKVDGSWRAYILKMPSLGSRDASGAVTHRLYDCGRPYVCWDRPVSSLRDMQTISKVWADNIQEYIATGKQFG